MSIHVHKTGLVKTLGQQSDAIVSTNLIGNFVPSQGIASTKWTNQAASNALGRINGIIHNNSSPHNFEFDGSDDYLGDSSGYGGTSFTVNPQNAFTIGQWVYLPSSWGSGKRHIVFCLIHDGNNYVAVQIDNSVMELHNYTYAGNYANASFGGPNLALNKGKWLYHTIVHSGSGFYIYYINGSFAGSLDANYAVGTGGNAANLEVGQFSDSYSENTTYTSANVKVGHIHVHSSALTNSQIRQNYLASHDMHNTRLYGDTTLA